MIRAMTLSISVMSTLVDFQWITDVTTVSSYCQLTKEDCAGVEISVVTILIANICLMFILQARREWDNIIFGKLHCNFVVVVVDGGVFVQNSRG